MIGIKERRFEARSEELGMNNVDDVRQDEINDWRFAAMVVDRLCLCAFTIFTVVSTFTILFSAPSFYAR